MCNFRILEEFIESYYFSNLPDIQVPLKVSPANLRVKKSSNVIVSPIIPVSSGGVSHITLRIMSPKTARITSVAINMPFQFRSDPALATSS